MVEDISNNIGTKGLIHSYDPYMSTPQNFIDFIKLNGKTNYRSTLWVDFKNFKYKYFIVFFSEKGSGGQIQAWGLCDRDISIEKSQRIKKKNDSGDPFLDIDCGFPGDKNSLYKRIFHYRTIELFRKPHNCTEFNLIKTGQPITKTDITKGILRNVLYVEIPLNIMGEIKRALSK